MEGKLGIIAGSGEIVSFVVKKICEEHKRIYLAAIKGEASPELSSLVADSRWFHVSDFKQIISFFKEKGAQKVLMLGKVRPTAIWETTRADNRELSVMLDSLPDRSAKTVILRAMDYFQSKGLEIGDLTPYIRELFLPPGVVTRRHPTSQEEDDARYGLLLARKLADLEIGQTIVVKDKAVVAVEAIEGTDETIKRAGHLVGRGTVVVKVGRTNQDNRVDLPLVGRRTIEAMKFAGATALFIEQGKVAFLNHQESIDMADKEGIAIKILTLPEEKL